MRVDLSLLTAIAALGVSAVALYSNPRRAINRVFLSLSSHAALWLLALRMAILTENGVIWVRVSSAIGAFIPLHLWLVKETLIGLANFRRRLLSGLAWGLLAIGLAALCFSEVFIPSHSTAEQRVRGFGYYTYIGTVLSLHFILLIESYRTARRSSGGSRLELQVWLLGCCIITTLVILLMALNALAHNAIYIRLQPLVILLFYCGTVVAITTHRIFDARQLLLVGLQKVILLGLAATLAYLSDYLFGFFIPEPFSFILTTVLVLWFAASLNGWLNSVFQFYPQATAARQAAFAVARRESRLENLETAFVGILKGWGQSDHALLVSGGKEGLRGGGVEVAGDAVAVQGLRQLRWVTPERLAREKATPDRVALAEFLENHNLGALVIGEGPTLTAFIGVGVAASRRPFTFPQVTQLMELASIIESALERAHFSVKAQHAEQLATVGLLGASLAHEIRNPLVSIKTFVQLLPTHHQDPAFRDKFFTLIGEEVSRIDRLTEQLLDLASPRAYVAEIIELHPVLRASLDLVAAKATDKRIQFLTDFQASPDQALTDASAAKQVLLNLCFNAIQAVESRPDGERWVKVSTRNVHLGVEMLVEDSGPGIAPEIRSKLFQPFHSTKSTGFGLGLAICSDILGGLNATISVDSSAPGQGAAFRVTFPCPVLSSS